MTSVLETEALEFVRELIRIESVNTGNPSTIGDGETRAARFVQKKLTEVGITSELIEPTPGRASLIARIPGTDREAPALLAHAHLDVVPVEGQQWTRPPFGAEIHDGFLYGRGAVDMKNFAGTLLAVLRHYAREGLLPRRDLVIAFLADEEHGGAHGAGWLVRHRPELFAGVTEAIGVWAELVPVYGSIPIAEDGSVTHDGRWTMPAPNTIEPFGSSMQRKNGCVVVRASEFGSAGGQVPVTVSVPMRL